MAVEKLEFTVHEFYRLRFCHMYVVSKSSHLFHKILNRVHRNVYGHLTEMGTFWTYHLLTYHMLPNKIKTTIKQHHFITIIELSLEF
jgi:elongation factor P--beta-lysine ligase